jgi:hypothetical protein
LRRFRDLPPTDHKSGTILSAYCEEIRMERDACMSALPVIEAPRGEQLIP